MLKCNGLRLIIKACEKRGTALSHRALWGLKAPRYFSMSVILFLLTGCAFITLPFSSDDEIVDLEMLSEAQQKHFELSLHYIDSAHYDIAETKLLSVIEEYPRFPDAYNALGVIYERRGRVTQAGEAFYQAIILNPNYDVAVNNYSDLKCYVTDGDAIKQSADIEIAPRVKSRLYTAAAKCYINKNDFLKGQEAAHDALAFDDHYALSYLYLAKTQYVGQQYQAARRSIDRFNDLNGYTKESASLGYSINRFLNDAKEMKKYEHVLKTQFNGEI